MGVSALLNSTSSWKPASAIHVDDGGDSDDPTESAAEWRHRVLRLVTAKGSLTVCTVAGEVFQKDGGDRGRPDHPVLVPTPTARLYAVYGRSLAMAATHTKGEQVGTVNVLILVQKHSFQAPADESTDDDSDGDDRRIR